MIIDIIIIIIIIIIILSLLLLILIYPISCIWSKDEIKTDTLEKLMSHFVF